MEDRELLFDGNEKRVYAAQNPDEVIFHFKDVAVCYHNIKKAMFPGKGAVTNKISSYIFEYLRKNGVDTHYIKMLSDNEQLCRKIAIIPLEIVVRNFIAGPLADKLGVEEGTKAEPPIYDLNYNIDELGDPFINDSQAVALGLIKADELQYMYATAKRINELLVELFRKVDIKLVDIKLEFGRATTGEIIVSDEISPDTSRFWDAKTDKRLDKDRFRHDLGYIVASYQEVLDRLESIKE